MQEELFAAGITLSCAGPCSRRLLFRLIATLQMFFTSEKLNGFSAGIGNLSAGKSSLPLRVLFSVMTAQEFPPYYCAMQRVEYGRSPIVAGIGVHGC